MAAKPRHASRTSAEDRRQIPPRNQLKFEGVWRDRQTAFLSSERRGKYFNLFVWPSAWAHESAEAADARQGYNLLFRTRGRTNFWAISHVKGPSYGSLQASCGLAFPEGQRLGGKRTCLASQTNEASTAAMVQPTDTGSAQMEASGDLPLAEPLLIVQVVELSQPCGQLFDPGMQEMIELAFVSRASGATCEHSVAVARAQSEPQKVDSLVASDLEDPGGGETDLRTDFPDSDSELLEKVRSLIRSDAVAVGHASHDVMKVR